MAKANGVRMVSVVGTRINNWEEILNILQRLKENDILFIDEIHLLKPRIQVELYGVLEDFQYDFVERHMYSDNKIIKKALPHFTTIGATTHAGDLSLPLRRRFPLVINLVPYTIEQLQTIVQNAARRAYNVCDFPVDAARNIAKISKTNASTAVNMLSNLMEIVEAEVPGKVTGQNISLNSVDDLIKMHSLDPIVGLDRVGRNYLITLAKESRAVGISQLAILINEEDDTVKNMIEPFLLSDISADTIVNGKSYVIRGPLAKATRSGREITPTGVAYLKACAELQKDGWLVGEKLYGFLL
jgi:Holliday junction DNA helicase RuvB